MKTRFWISVALIALVVPCALAQGGGGRGGQRGGAALLSRPDVATELKLTDAQKSAIAEKLPAAQGRGQGGGAGGAGGAGAAGGAGGGQARGQGAGGAEARAAQLATIKGILDANQFARYQELDLQRTGASAVLRPELAEKLGVTEDQRTKIVEINAAQREEQRAMTQGGGDRTQMQEALAKLRSETNKKILDLLTVKQRESWMSLLGKAFKFEDGA